MTDPEEQAYENGSRMAWRILLSLCLGHLGVDDPEASEARWVAERTDVVAALRQVCGEHGDNDWDDGDHLGDVIDKHLKDHLEQ